MKQAKVSYIIGCSYNGRVTDSTLQGLVLELNRKLVHVPNVVGNYNAFNLLMVYAVACELGMDSEKVLEGLAHLKPVKECLLLQPSYLSFHSMPTLYPNCFVYIMLKKNSF